MFLIWENVHSLNVWAKCSLLSFDIEFDSRNSEYIVSSLVLGVLKGLSPPGYCLSNFGMGIIQKVCNGKITILTPTLLCDSLSHLCWYPLFVTYHSSVKPPSPTRASFCVHNVTWSSIAKDNSSKSLKLKNDKRWLNSLLIWVFLEAFIRKWKSRTIALDLKVIYTIIPFIFIIVCHRIVAHPSIPYCYILFEWLNGLIPGTPVHA